MAHSLKVVFRADVRGIAQAGDVKMVSPGYARNFLFPRDLAFPASEQALRQWETERQGILAKAARQREQAQSLAQKIEAATCTITAKAGPEGRLFGSVGRAEIVEALARESIAVDKRYIVLAEPLKQIGAAQAQVRLPGGVQAQLKINVIAEG
ncbi:MAG TPA: 50S ribosomal protein L9 [Elusimicrobiota bacterium]|nr:50S ribosomal protein L9 [Elusimicrobiota bacterium]